MFRKILAQSRHVEMLGCRKYGAPIVSTFVEISGQIKSPIVSTKCTKQSECFDNIKDVKKNTSRRGNLNCILCIGILD